MTDILYMLIIFPIETLISLFYGIFLKMFEIHGIAIVLLSVSVNIMLLPLYNVAEKWQQKERDLQNRLRPKLDDIKSVFKGAERHMIIRTYYRQNHYHPVYSLRNVIGLAIQVPFFIAAYHLLSHMPMTDTTSSYYFISDLRLEDQLIRIGSITVNLLPILMTVINLVSAFVYSGNLQTREKRQLVVMAFIFLALLYKSPAGLVLYWTLNNVFSLLKNILHAGKNPGKKFYFILTGFLAFIFIYSLLLRYPLAMKMADLGHLSFKSGKILKINILAGLIFSLVFIVPFAFRFLNRFVDTLFTGNGGRESMNNIFYISCTVLFILTGLLAPSLLIAAAPLEFTEKISGIYYNPALSLFHSAFQAFSVFMFIPSVLYFLFPGLVRKYLSLIYFLLSVFSLVNIFIFPGSYGVINSDFTFDNSDILRPSFIIAAVNSFVLFFSAVAGIFLIKRNYCKIIYNTLIIIVTSLSVVSFYNIYRVNTDFTRLLSSRTENSGGLNIDGFTKPFIFNSGEGRNVIVIMLDRAQGGLTGEILKHNPEFFHRMSGFTWYPNTVSFNGHTLLGAPPLFGGYEYTPLEMNKRENMTLEEKHNESLTVLPRLFLEQGYRVVSTDPRTDYESSLLTHGLYDKYPEIHSENLIGKYTGKWISENIGDTGKSSSREILNNYLFNFSLFRIAPNYFRSRIYDGSRWLKPATASLPFRFLNSYSVLDYLPELSGFNSEISTFNMMVNDSVHEPRILEIYNEEKFNSTEQVGNNYKVLFKRKYTLIHFYSQIGAFIKLAEWFDYLKENNAYDNTKIIIVSDHGRDIDDPYFFDFEDNEKDRNEYTFYHPLLLVKDFNRKGDLTISDKFMTNADVPSIATSHLKDARNPFTGNKIAGNYKKNGVDIVTIHKWKANRNMGNKFDFKKEDIVHVKENIFIKENWIEAGK